MVRNDGEVIDRLMTMMMMMVMVVVAVMMVR